MEKSASGNSEYAASEMPAARSSLTSQLLPLFLLIAIFIAGRIAIISAVSVYILISAAVISSPFIVASGGASFELSYFLLEI